MNINQKESPEAYREYMREYQRQWRKKNPHYYRDLKRKQTQELDKMENSMKQEVKELKKEITRLQNVIAYLEMKMNAAQKEDIDDNLYKSVLPSTQACSEEEFFRT